MMKLAQEKLLKAKLSGILVDRVASLHDDFNYSRLL